MHWFDVVRYTNNNSLCLSVGTNLTTFLLVYYFDSIAIFVPHCDSVVYSMDKTKTLVED